MFQPLAEEGINESKAEFFLKEAAILIHNGKISAAYNFIIIAYDYLLNSASWGGTFKVGNNNTSLHSVAFYLVSQISSFKNLTEKRRYNQVNVFFAEEVVHKCQPYEADFVQAYAHLVIEYRIVEWSKRLEGVVAIDKYLCTFPECEKGYYLKATLLTRCYIPNSTRNLKQEALVAIESALKLKKTPRSLLLKAKILEAINYKADNPQESDDKSILTLHELCVLGLFSSVPLSLLHTYAHENRAVTLPVRNDNSLLKLFNTRGSLFQDYLKDTLYKVCYVHNLGANAGKYYQDNRIEIAKSNAEYKELIDVLSSNKFLFTYQSYKDNKRPRPITKSYYNSNSQSSSELEEEYQAGFEDNEFYDDNLDMDQQSQEFWDN